MDRHSQADLEAAILASLLWRPQLAASAMHHIPDDLWTCSDAFCDEDTRKLSQAIYDCWQHRRESNPTNVLAAGRMAGEDLTAVIQRVMSTTPGEGEASLERMARDLGARIRLQRFRGILAHATAIISGDIEPEQAIADAVARINNNVGTSLNIVDASAGSRDIWDYYHTRKDGGGQAIGIPTGLSRIDRICGGIPTSAVTIIGARPSQGKTALAGCIALHAAEAGHPVIFYSHEMAASDIYQRIVANKANISYPHLRSGRLSARGEQKLADALASVQTRHLAVIDDGGPLPSDCRTTAMYLINKWQVQKAPLIIVDYVQLEHMSSDVDPRCRPQELQMISHYWCETAKMMGAGVILLSQLNRDAAGNAPTMSQLAQCGALEQDANCIMLLWRPAKDRAQNLADATPDPADRKKAGYNWGVLSVAKSRNSDLTEQELHFSGYNMRFRNWLPTDHHQTKSAMLQAEYNAVMADIITNSQQTAAPSPL